MQSGEERQVIPERILENEKKHLPLDEFFGIGSEQPIGRVLGLTILETESQIQGYRYAVVAVPAGLMGAGGTRLVAQGSGLDESHMAR